MARAHRRGIGRHLAALAGGALIALAAAMATAAPVEITGTVNWGTETRVPPGARVSVRLIDAGSAEGAVELAAIVLAPGEEGPLRFRLLYDDALIAPQGTYRLTAKMTVGKLALMESLRATPVLTVGGTADPEILLERIAIGVEAGARNPVGRDWVAQSVFDEPLTGPVRVTLRLDDDGTARGSTGCNEFRATYEASPEVLDFGAFALTKRGCQTPVMRVERRVLKVLREVRGWRINAGELLLLDGAGTAMMRLEEGR